MPHMLTTRISAWKTRPESDHEVGCPSSLKEKGAGEVSNQPPRASTRIRTKITAIPNSNSME